MAVFNGLPFVTQSIDSILAQTMPDFEFIIVNDASSDGTRAALDAYDDPRLRIVHLEKNGGQTAALNHGLKLATSPLLARQDADDISRPERLATQIQFLDEHTDHLMVGTAADLIDDSGKVTGLSEHPTSDKEVRAMFATGNNCFYHGSVMFRRQVLDEVGMYREGFRNSQDYDYWLRIAEAGKVTNLPAPPLYQYRLHAGQMTFTSYYRMKAEWKLAEKLAAIRANGEGDSEAYAAGAAELAETFADFTPTRAERRRALAELWRGKGVAYMNDGRRLPMMYCLLRAFLHEPDNPDFWRGVRNHIPGL